MAARKKLRPVAQGAKMPSAKAAKPKGMGRGMTAHKLPSGGAMSIGAKLGGGKAKRAGGAAKAPRVAKGKGTKLPKTPLSTPAAFRGRGKKGAPPFLGAAPPLE